jgi:hypothetical protein
VIDGHFREASEDFMPNYHFRFRFLLPHDRVLGSEEQSLELYSSTEHGHYVLEAVSGTSLEESQWALIKDAGEGFATAGEAAEAGRHVKNAVMWWSATQRVGVDVGTDSTSVVVTQTAIDQFREQGIRVLNEVHGLQVYREDPELPTKFVWSTVRADVSKSVEDFRQNFREIFDLGLEFTERESLAFELYGLSHFEAAERARFLTLINAIESVCEPRMRSPKAVNHVDNLIELTCDSDLAKGEVESLVSSLQWLRKEAISKTGRDFAARVLGAKRYDGKVAKQFFQHCYDVRSDIVHRGKPSDDTVLLRNLIGELDRFVADLLLTNAKRSQG